MDRTRGENGTLVSHVAASNDHVEFLKRGLPSIAILMDAGHYVSSSWYPGCPERDSAPTWSFMVAHIHGTPKILSEAATAKHLQELVKHMEKGRDKPWQMKELGPGGLERRLRNIVGYEMPIEKMEVKFKLGQDERAADMSAAIKKLHEEGREHLAEMMARHCKL
ncbi:FMN-binding negative transcriptional regulator, partial [Brucella intermedia]|uniref:FMN-binding negative transcriptional regulator n=2 Tax=Brucella/Ochrobactrum group TaxID=2826938 RepID=UPI0009894571